MKELGELKTFRYVKWTEVERLIREEFRLPHYEIAADEEWDNDSCYKINVEAEPFDEYDSRKLAKAYDGGSMHVMYMLRSLLCDLAARGVIPPGEYLIWVSW